MRDPFYVSVLVAPTLAFVRARGGNADALKATFGLPEDVETRREVSIPISVFHRFMDASANAIEDPFLGVHLMPTLPRGTFGILEYSWRSAPTIRDGLYRLVRYTSLINPILKMTVSRDDRFTRLEHRIQGIPLCSGRHANEGLIFGTIAHARQISGEKVAPSRAWFAHPAPGDRGELERALGCSNLDFDAGTNGLELPNELVDLKILSSDPPLFEILDQQAERELVRRGQTPFLSSVRERVHEALLEGPPSLSAISKKLETSSRSLQRRIEDEGSSFQDIVDSVRAELAQFYVADETRALTDIAYALGYRHLSAFLRAFKRWTNQTPSSFRATRHSSARGECP